MTDVRQNYLLGLPKSTLDLGYETLRMQQGMLVLYTFHEGKGRSISDSNKVHTLNLTIPRLILFRWKDDIWLRKHITLRNDVLNVIAYLPIGFLLLVLLRKPNTTSSTGTISKILIASCSGLIFSLIMEAIQYLSKSRYSVIHDIVTNSLGALLGAVLGSFLTVRLENGNVALGRLRSEIWRSK